MTLTCQHSSCSRSFERNAAQDYCSPACQYAARKNLTAKLCRAMLSCFTRAELVLLRTELDVLLANKNYQPKVI